MATKVAQRSVSPSRVEADETAETAGQEPAHRRRTATVNLPFVTAEFRAPEIHLPSLPDRDDLTDAVSTIKSRMPSPAQVAYYAGLGVLAAVEIIEWPVALAIGVGTALVQHQVGTQDRETAQRAEPTPSAEAKPGTTAKPSTESKSSTAAKPSTPEPPARPKH